MLLFRSDDEKEGLAALLRRLAPSAYRPYDNRRAVEPPAGVEPHAERRGRPAVGAVRRALREVFSRPLGLHDRRKPEVKGLYGPHPNSPPGSTTGCKRRMDLFFWQGAYRLLVDETRIDGATDSYLRRALAVTQPLHGVEEAEKEKHKRYPDSPAPMEFKPVAVGTQIELGASAREVIGMLAKRAAARTSTGLTPTSAAVARETRIIMGSWVLGLCAPKRRRSRRARAGRSSRCR